MKMVKKLNKKMVEKMVVTIQVMLMQISNKVKEQSGADGSTEKTGWIIAVLIIVGLLIAFINKFFPMVFESVGNKLMEMFNLIKTS